MPDASDLISFSDAAEDLDCGRTTLYRAVNDGRLNDTEVSGRRMLVMDEKYKAFEPKETGARTHRDKDTSNDSE